VDAFVHTQAILLAIQQCLGEEWNKEVKSAWEYLWLKVSCSVASSLSVGTSLVNVALVQVFRSFLAIGC
jgi:hypothetical protein